MAIEYSRAERLWLWGLAVFGLVGVNGVFLWSLFNRPEAIREAMANPVSAVFAIEALVLVGFLAWLFRKWGVSWSSPKARTTTSPPSGRTWSWRPSCACSKP